MEIPAFVCSHVFHRMKDILLVSREDGDWQFLCGDVHEDESPRVIGLNHIFEEFPGLLELKDLPENWEAVRRNSKEPWTRYPI